MLRTLALLATLALCTAAPVQARDSLVALINAYRADPPPCEGRAAAPVAALTPHPALAAVEVAPGAFLEQALERAGYPAAHAEAIYLSGPADPPAVLAAIAHKYCRTLLNAEFSHIGATRSGDGWLIVLARPAPPSRIALLRGPGEAGRAILEAVNTARASPRRCGARAFGAAPPLRWNAALGQAALAHSADMARLRYLSHVEKNGGTVGERALQAGYRWRRIAENIAVGQESPDEVVAGWIASPGHCANLMSPDVSDMGAAYAVNGERVYWTQVFGQPR